MYPPWRVGTKANRVNGGKVATASVSPFGALDEPVSEEFIDTLADAGPGESCPVVESVTAGGRDAFHELVYGDGVRASLESEGSAANVEKHFFSYEAQAV